VQEEEEKQKQQEEQEQEEFLDAELQPASTQRY